MIENYANKLMIVEDEAVIALRLKQRLAEMGYDVVGVAYSGEEAVEKAKSLTPELILMDIMIPGKFDGIAAAEIIKTECDIPVVFLTAKVQRHEVDRLEGLGWSAGRVRLEHGRSLDATFAGVLLAEGTHRWGRRGLLALHLQTLAGGLVRLFLVRPGNLLADVSDLYLVSIKPN